MKPWPKGQIPYVVSLTLNQAQTDLIENSMRAIQNVTCVRFVPQTFEPDYIFITLDLKCESPIGYLTEGGEHILYLSPHCLTPSDVLHQLAHVVGLHHEHNRYDRDYHIEVNWDNINEESWPKFKKMPESYNQFLDLPYDYNSVTHFNWNSSSKNGLPTVLSKRDYKRNTVDGLSSIDILKMNRMYKCSSYFIGSQRLKNNGMKKILMTQFCCGLSL